MRVSENRRYLTTDGGEPFFYLADTAWTLFYKPSLAEAREYYENRRRKGFTVIMPVLIWHEDTNPENPNGELPLHDMDPSRPNEAFFSHVDALVDAAEATGLLMAILPTWGEFVGPLWHGMTPAAAFDPAGKGPEIFTPENARLYGEFLAKRYGDRSVMWVLGGDRLPVEDTHVAIWRALADGLRSGGRRNLITYHPCGVHSSSEFFHDEDWLDFNMMQTTTRWDFDNYRMIAADYSRSPTKPVIDGETRYEDSYERFGARRPNGRRVPAHQVRKAAFNAMLSGALGHTYGCRDVWYFYEPSAVPPKKDVKTHWKRAMDFPGAWQMRHLRDLFTSYPWYDTVPDFRDGDAENANRRIVTHGSGTGGTYVPAARASDGRFLLAYVPETMPVWIDPGVLAAGNGEPRGHARTLTARWFDPRTGAYRFERKISSPGEQRFDPPRDGPDWVLVIERE